MKKHGSQTKALEYGTCVRILQTEGCGSDSDQTKRYPRRPLVGKKICYTCIARALKPPIQDNFEIRWLLIAEIAVFITLAASLPITGLPGVDRTIPGILLLLSITFFVSERWIRRAMRKRQSSKPENRSEQVVSTEKLFENRENSEN